MAQLNEDNNWELITDEQFNGNRGWNRNFVEEHLDNPNRNPIWRCFIDEWNSGVTRGYKEHQVFQRSQCIFNSAVNPLDGRMDIIAEHISDTNLECGDYELLPPSSWHHYHCDSLHPSLFYFSGNIETIEEILYGYFEVRCKLPVHRGAFPAFWLWGGGGGYEEIDIFEYSWVFTDTLKYPNTEALYLGDNRCFTAGVYINDDGETDSLWKEGSARVYPRISEDKPSVDQWNTWGCLWMPDRVEWYLNGELFNSLYDVDKIPNNPMYLIINYAIDNYTLEKDSVYYDANDTMYIDYIRAYQPKWDCMSSILIDEQRDLDNYKHGIKSSVSICSDNSTSILVAANKKIDIMASESVTISGPFQVDVGADFSISMQKCP